MAFARSTSPSRSSWWWKTRVGLRRSLRLRDDVPDVFAVDPVAFDVQCTRPSSGDVLSYRRSCPSGGAPIGSSRLTRLVASRLGFWRRHLVWPLRTEVRVYPDIHQIARYTMLARRDRLSTLGLRRSRRLGTDNEFERLRDYLVGDDPRHVDWRATRPSPQVDLPGVSAQPESADHLHDRLRAVDGRQHRRRALAARPRLQRDAAPGTCRLDPRRPGRLAGLLRPHTCLCRSRRRTPADQSHRAQRAQRVSRDGRITLRSRLHRARAALPETIPGRPDDEPVRRSERPDRGRIPAKSDRPALTAGSLPPRPRLVRAGRHRPRAWARRSIRVRPPRHS